MAVLVSLKSTLIRMITIWQDLNGDAAYRRYLAHWHHYHDEEGSKPMSRKMFFAAETQRKWNGIKRCC